MNHRKNNMSGIWVIMVLLLTAPACEKKKPAAPELSDVVSDPVMGLIVADTITYDVVITNTDPENTWEEERLQGLNHKALIDNIFYMIDAGKAVAHDYETNEQLTAKQIRNIENEPDYDRGQIGMIQFTEIWFLNPEKGELIKKVHSMVLGYNFYTSDGTLFGHSPMFRIVLGVSVGVGVGVNGQEN